MYAKLKGDKMVQYKSGIVGTISSSINEIRTMIVLLIIEYNNLIYYDNYKI